MKCKSLRTDPRKGTDTALCRNIIFTALVGHRFEFDVCAIEDSNHHRLIEMVWSCDGMMILWHLACR